YLNNLAVSLEDRFRQRGVPSDLDERIELHRAALLQGIPVPTAHEIERLELRLERDAVLVERNHIAPTSK
ncbi:hypothetical protein P692DRAFT_201875336, partial [Suillus brevipes Sb2]